MKQLAILLACVVAMGFALACGDDEHPHGEATHTHGEGSEHGEARAHEHGDEGHAHEHGGEAHAHEQGEEHGHDHAEEEGLPPPAEPDPE